jgi:hypothetical protein
MSSKRLECTFILKFDRGWKRRGEEMTEQDLISTFLVSYK